MNYTATFLSLFRMMDMLHIEEDCWVYRENMRWNGKPICPHCGSTPSITTNILREWGQRAVQVQGLSL